MKIDHLWTNCVIAKQHAKKKAPEIADNNSVAKEDVTGQDTSESDEKVKEKNGREEGHNAIDKR